jgi:hypothetical protein
MIEDVGRPAPPQSPEAKRGRRVGTTVAALLLVAVAAVGVALLVGGLRSLSDADKTRARVAELRRERHELIQRTGAAEAVTDAPIGGAERVANSVASVVEATDAVILESGDTNQLLSQAVRQANAGDRTAANRIYDGEAAESVRRLQEALARADSALAAAQQAAADLEATTR